MTRTRDKVFPYLSLHLCQFVSLTVHQAVQEFYNRHGRKHFHREHKLGMRLPVHAESPASAADATNIECVPEAREEGLVENLVNVIGDLVTESPVESAGLAQVGNQVGDVLEVEETVVRSDVSELLDQVNV